MGNQQQGLTIFKEYEHKSGRRLISAIKNNSRQETEDAIEFCRHEFTKPLSGTIANASDYDMMHKRLEQYLLSPKDTGDGIIFKKTPLEMCKDIGSNESGSVIIEHLNRLGVQLPTGTTKFTAAPLDLKDRGVESVNVGFVNLERSNLAKERLKAFQATKH